MRSRGYDWSDFLEVADALLASVGGEGAERTAISRAYYASYGMACAHALTKNLVLARKGSDHTTIWTWYANQPERGTAHASIAQAGRRLKRWRIRADYDDGFDQASTTAILAMGTARQLQQDLKELP